MVEVGDVTLDALVLDDPGRVVGSTVEIVTAESLTVSERVLLLRELTVAVVEEDSAGVFLAVVDDVESVIVDSVAIKMYKIIKAFFSIMESVQ